jgi:hypothetical protein
MTNRQAGGNTVSRKQRHCPGAAAQAPCTGRKTDIHNIRQAAKHFITFHNILSRSHGQVLRSRFIGRKQSDELVVVTRPVLRCSAVHSSHGDAGG